jgi:hypothetical protein
VQGGAAGAIEAEMSVLPPAVLTHHPAPGGWCVQEVVGARDGKALLDELLRRRAESVTLVAALGSNDLMRAGRHPTVGPLRVNDVLHEWVHHDRNHLRQILANVQSYAWPHMGNARRFTTG